MERIEEVPHLLSLFRQLDDGKRLVLVERLRDIAIEALTPVLEQVRRPVPNHIKAAYSANGISTQWDLTTSDAYEFSLLARNSGLPPSQTSAVELLYACTKTLDDGAVTDQMQERILDAYQGLDLDNVATGKKFRKGRKLNTSGTIRRAIANLLKKTPTMKNLEIWAALAATPPRGCAFYDNELGKYVEHANSKPATGYSRFCNIASEERSKLKG